MTDTMKETTEADGDEAATTSEVDAEQAETRGGWRTRLGPAWRLVSAVLLVALVATGAFAYVKYHGVADELAGLRQEQANADTAAQKATDYALKSLNYSFNDPDAFFRSVEEGVSDSLRDKYVNATELLKGIMVQAQVTSTGEVLATEVNPQPGGTYQVVVSASQTTRNLQNAEPRVSIILLQVTVNHVGDTWQITDIGPKTGSTAAAANQIQPPKPAPGPSRPAPPPTPPR